MSFSFFAVRRSLSLKPKYPQIVLNTQESRVPFLNCVHQYPSTLVFDMYICTWDVKGAVRDVILGQTRLLLSLKATLRE